MLYRARVCRIRLVDDGIVEIIGSMGIVATCVRDIGGAIEAITLSFRGPWLLAFSFGSIDLTTFEILKSFIVYLFVYNWLGPIIYVCRFIMMPTQPVKSMPNSIGIS